MRIPYYMFLIALLTNSSARSQMNNNNIFGSWVLVSDYEFPDIIIVRPDHRYFVYNSSSVSPESLGKTDSLKGSDIRINGAYTSMTQCGMWSFDSLSKKLMLTDRESGFEWTDFRTAYGSGDTLIFHLKYLMNDEMELCFRKGEGLLCDQYERLWSKGEAGSSKVTYHEIDEDHFGLGSDTIKFTLTGYETELHLSYEFYNEADQLTVTGENGKELFRTTMTRTRSRIQKSMTIQGVTEITFSVKASSQNSEWRLRLNLK